MLSEVMRLGRKKKDKEKTGRLLEIIEDEEEGPASRNNRIRRAIKKLRGK